MQVGVARSQSHANWSKKLHQFVAATGEAVVSLISMRKVSQIESGDENKTHTHKYSFHQRSHKSWTGVITTAPSLTSQLPEE